MKWSVVLEFFKRITRPLEEMDKLSKKAPADEVTGLSSGADNSFRQRNKQ
jgi:hypothetical protein